MTKRQGWLALMLLSAIAGMLDKDYMSGAVFYVLGFVFLLCWFMGKD
jgi:hypothetical protein